MFITIEWCKAQAPELTVQALGSSNTRSLVYSLVDHKKLNNEGIIPIRYMCFSKTECGKKIKKNAVITRWQNS